MLSLHSENKEYFDRVKDYEEQDFIPHYLLDRRNDEEAWIEEIRKQGEREWY